jgi:uncharacterized UBP type Zn finger protein
MGMPTSPDMASCEASMPAPQEKGDDAHLDPCDHVVAIHPVQPQAGGCQPCLDRGDTWVRLCQCQSCGWVACSDDSPNQHAKAHYEETDHPIVVLLQCPYPIRCYVHQRNT